MTSSFDKNFFPPSQIFKFGNRKKSIGWNQFIAQFVVLSLERSTCGTARCLNEMHFFARQSRFNWLPNVNYASFLAEIWPERVRRVDLLRCRVIKWIVAPFHGNLPNLLNDPRIFIPIKSNSDVPFVRSSKSTRIVFGKKISRFILRMIICDWLNF